MKNMLKNALSVFVALAVALTMTVPVVGMANTQQAQAAQGYSETASGVFSNGTYKYYVKKLKNGSYRLFKKNIKKKSVKVLKTFKKAKAYKYRVTAVRGTNVYIARIAKKTSKSTTFVFNTKKKKVTKRYKNVYISSTSGAYAIVKAKKAANTTPAKCSLYKLTKTGLKKLKALGAKCAAVKYVGAKVYYAVYPSSGKMNSVKIYRISRSGTGKKLLCSYSLKSAKKSIYVKSYKAKYCTIYYYSNGKKVTKKLYYTTSPTYAEQEATFLAKDIEDFGGYTVINLDDDETTNYTVLSKSTQTVQATEAENTLVRADDSTLTYVIENITDAISCLKAGDILYYIYGDGYDDYTLVKIETITVSGQTAMIVGDTSAELSDFFTYIDVDMDVSVAADYFTPAEDDDELSYEGYTVEEVADSSTTSSTASGMLLQSTVVDYSGSTELVNHTFTYKESGCSLNITIALTANVYLRYDFELWGEDYVESSLSLVPTLDVEATISASYSKDIKKLVGSVACPIGPTGLALTGEVYFVSTPSCSGSVKASYSLDASVTAGYVSGSGFTTSVEYNGFDVDLEAKAEFSVTGGLELDAGLTFLKVIEVTAAGSASLKLTGETDTTVSYNTSDGEITSDLIHECYLCIDGEVDAVAKISATCTTVIKELGSKSAEYSYKLTDFYLSLLSSSGSVDFGLGSCPNKQYRTTVTVADSATGDAVSGAAVYLDDAYLDATGDDGTVTTYCANGEHSMYVQASGYVQGTMTFTVADAAQSVQVYLTASSSGQGTSESTGSTGTEDSAESMDIPADAVTYNGHSYYLYDLSDIDTWAAAEAYCESLGGYLASITTQAENDFLYSYITSLGYTSAYFGLNDAEEEGTWVWANGEAVDYVNWGGSEPNSENSNEDYAMFYYKYTDGTWNDGDFGHKTNGGGQAFICEWDAA